ncbi:hypothetical protein N9Y37_09175 [Luminiphilus sp.]|nr:hypothetical protein [Luminiphilus sp.]
MRTMIHSLGHRCGSLAGAPAQSNDEKGSLPYGSGKAGNHLLPKWGGNTLMTTLTVVSAVDLAHATGDRAASNERW